MAGVQKWVQFHADPNKNMSHLNQDLNMIY